MAFKQANRTKQVATTTGTGPFTLGSTPVGLQPFSATYGAGDTFYYVADDGAGNWEIGVGTFTDATHFARSTLIASSSGGFVNFTAVPTLWVDLPASKCLTVDPTGNVTITGAITIGGVTNTGVTGTGNIVFSASPTFTGTILGLNTNFSGTMQAAAVTVTGPIIGANLALGGASLGGNALAVTGAAAISGNGTFGGTLGVTGAITGAGYAGGPISGTTGAFSGASSAASLALGGASLGGNALAVNGNADISGGLTLAGDLNVTATGSDINIQAGGVTATTNGFTATGFGNTANLNFSGSIVTNDGSGMEMVCVSNGVVLNNGATAWAAVSDETTKTDFQPITDAIGKTKQLRTTTWRYKFDDKSVRRVGLIAQDVQKVQPELVTEGKDGKLQLAEAPMVTLAFATLNEIITRLEAAEAKLGL